jgi:hypothetical protein
VNWKRSVFFAKKNPISWLEAGSLSDPKGWWEMGAARRRGVGELRSVKLALRTQGPQSPALSGRIRPMPIVTILVMD